MTPLSLAEFSAALRGVRLSSGQ